jgi:cysteinyl-tRNA synthetase
MSWKHLGETFDIHGGGIDLVFPHHENEIAQSRCAFHTGVMANTWMHNGFLQVEGEKMSKSLGNFVTIHELLRTDKFGQRKWHGAVLRYAMLSTHYTQPIDWTVERLVWAHKQLSDFSKITQKVETIDGADVDNRVVSALCDDLNTPQVIVELNRQYSDVTHSAGDQKKASAFKATLSFLGVSADDLIPKISESERNLVEVKIAHRNAARARKDFKESDRIRDELVAMGVVLKDSKDGTTWEIAR